VTPPSQVTGLNVTSATGSQIDLDWTDVADAASYEVERSVAGQNTWSQVGTPATTSFSDTTVTTGQSYDYRVRGVDGSGNAGAWSSIVTTTASAAVLDFGIPANTVYETAILD
jgi:chitinase